MLIIIFFPTSLSLLLFPTPIISPLPKKTFRFAIKTTKEEIYSKNRESIGLYITKKNNHDKLCVFGIVSDLYFLLMILTPKIKVF